MKIIGCMLVVLALASCRQGPAQGYVPASQYDPRRDAGLDIKDAIAEAERTGKRVLLEVGGEWCKWCHIMDRYFQDHPKLTQLRDLNYVTVKVNFSEENLNEKVLSRYPKIPGYPHIFILDTDGKVLQSQNTGELEEDQTYNIDKFTAFLTKWARQAN
jgi:thioredoxin-related protein